MALRREIKSVEEQYEQTNEAYGELSKKLRNVTQERLNTEEELLASNVRLKQLLGELEAARAAAQAQSNAIVKDNKMTMGELTRKVESTLMTVLDERFRDEAFTSAITEQSVLSTDKVRVEFEGDEVFWSLQDNYSFEMLLADASRYWDVAPQDAILVDERGAIWPNDAYVGLELQRAANARITLKIKPVATTVEEDIEMYGKEGEESDSDEDDDFDMSLLAIATAAEDELLLAQAKGTTTSLTTKQKLALRRKLKYDMYYFLAFVVFFIVSMYTRRTIKDGYRLQEAISAAFTEENFGDYNEKTFLDIATAEELFDWMEGPLAEGLFPGENYNGLKNKWVGYVMTYNRLVGMIRLRQLRVAPNKNCNLTMSAIEQVGRLTTGVNYDGGTMRRRQFVDACYASYSPEAASNETFGLDPSLPGFSYTSAFDNGLEGSSITGQVGTYDGSGFRIDLPVTDVEVPIDPQGGPETPKTTIAAEDEFNNALGNLKANLWIDAQTRAVIISMNLYNGNYNYYCLAQYLIEFTPGGTVVPSANNKIISLDLYETDDLVRPRALIMKYTPDIFTILLSIGYLLTLLYKLYRIRRVTKTFRPFLRDSWNIIDLIILGFLGTGYYTRYQFYMNEDRRGFSPFELPLMPETCRRGYAEGAIDPSLVCSEGGAAYVEMTELASAYNFMFMLDAMLVIILVVKALKYFALQKDLMLLAKTLFQALQDLSTFLVILVFLFIGFIIMGYNIFGMQAEGFRDITTTLGTLFLILLGEFDYDEMRQVDELWAIVFFMFFVVFMFFIVLNIFLAILNDAYTVVHTDVVWEELEKRKPMSLREKFEVRKAIWRERKNIARMKKLKKDKVKQAKKMKKEYEKKAKDKAIFEKGSKKKRREEAEAQGLALGEGDGAGAVRRTAKAKAKPFE